MSWLKSLSHKLEGKKPLYKPPSDLPPGWTPAAEQSHTYGLRNEATDDEYESAVRFCRQNPVQAPKLLSSELVERINIAGCRLWTLDQPSSSRFVGQVVGGGEKGSDTTRVVTSETCGDVCLMSNLPLLAGLYDIQGKSGVYYEVCIRRMDGIIAIGRYHSQCRRSPLTDHFFQELHVVPTPIGDFPVGTEHLQDYTSMI